MERRPLGKTGLEVSVLGFGAAEIGFESTSPADVERLINSALDAGLNVIDTAECYVDSEEKVGNAVSHRRGDYHLFTKVGHPEGISGPEDWSRDGILFSIERSLQRLRTDHLDLVQLHSCSAEILERGEAILALQDARAKGQTRFIGYSGDGHAALTALQSGAFDTLQTSVSIADQEAITLTLPTAAASGVGVIAKRPIANAAWRHAEKPANEYHHVYWERLRALKYDFLSREMAAAVSIALRFTLAQPGVATAIVGTTNPSRWIENAELLDEGPLSLHDVNAIREVWHSTAKLDWTGQV